MIHIFDDRPVAFASPRRASRLSSGSAPRRPAPRRPLPSDPLLLLLEVVKVAAFVAAAGRRWAPRPWRRPPCALTGQVARRARRAPWRAVVAKERRRASSSPGFRGTCLNSHGKASGSKFLATGQLPPRSQKQGRQTSLGQEKGNRAKKGALPETALPQCTWKPRRALRAASGNSI